MIYIDYRKGADTKRNIPEEFVELIRKIGVPAQIADMPFADFAFEGNGPKGNIAVGIERKTLHDMLNCIDDGRISGHQAPGLKNNYEVRVLLIEGHWRPHDPEGLLMEGFNGGYNWGRVRHRNSRTMYSKLYRYLISVGLSGVIITYSRDLYHTAYNVCEWFHYFQKKWNDHTAMKEMHQVAIPTLGGKPPLVRRWAHAIEGIGTKHSEVAQTLFKTPIALAQADESEWLRIPGVGVKTAQQIVREIWGMK